MESIIVSRHHAAIEFIARELGGLVGTNHDADQYFGGPHAEGTYVWQCHLPSDTAFAIPVVASASADAVRGKRVYGNLPMHLAAEAAEVVAIEFTRQPPRGQEYTLAEMDAAGARLSRYIVRRADPQ